jgi:PAS domain S-box-containing protein
MELIRIRFFSNVLAALIVVPLIVSWASNGIAGLRTTRRLPYLEACVLFLGLLSVSYGVLYELGSGADAALLFLPLPFLLWAAVRFGSSGASSAISIVGFLAIWSGSHGHGPFSGGTAEQNALSIQIFLVALTIPILFLAAVIEERAAGQIDLREFEERVVLAAEAAHLGVWELDTVTNQVWMSDKARALFQFDLETPIDYSLLQDRVHPEDRARRDSALKRAIETHGEYEIEYRVLLPDGTFRWIAGRGRCGTERNGTGVRLIAVSMDVTPQKEAQDLFRLAAEGSRLGVWHWEEVAKTLSWDGAARKIFDVSVDEEITLDTFYRCLHPDDAERVKQTWRRAVESGLPYDIEFRTQRTDGSIRWLHGRGRGYYDKAGKPLWMTGVVFDITAQKEAELEAKQRRDELSHLSRLALMGEMSASFAHELNQPLAGIASNAGAGQRFIDRGNVDLQEIRELLADIGADARRASDVVRGIRGMIKKEQTAHHPINLNDVVTNVAQMMKADALLHASELKTSLEANLPIVEADPVQIQQVLINLVVNAFDAMRETPESKRKVEITTQQSGDRAVRVSVRDNGVGISEEMRSRLFKRFCTTKPDGMGMGLAIVRSIVESHGGTVAAENIEDGGARFHFTVPASTATL